MRLLNLEQVSELISIPVSTLRKWAKSKYLPAFKLGTNWRVSEEDLSQWIAKQKLEEKKKEESSAPLSITNIPQNPHLASEKGGNSYEY
jgi:excisionase family DNA binding protein